MASTERLYLHDPYCRTFTARVLSCRAQGQQRYRVVLDRTCFYPASGGQSADRGVLGGAEVLDVVEEGEEVVHFTAVPLQGEVRGEVDWPRRFDHMQQHTGQHILSRAFLQVADAATVSFHMGEQSCTIDLDTETVSPETLRTCEELANRVIWERRPVKVFSIDASELASQDIRRALPAGADLVRVVEVENFDRCPCCGTHVANGAEVGLVKVLRQERARGRVRVHFLAGRRAWADYEEKHGILVETAGLLTTSWREVRGKVERLIEERKQEARKVRQMEKKLLEVDRRELLSQRLFWRGRRLFAALCYADSYARSLLSSLRDQGDSLIVLGSRQGAVFCQAFFPGGEELVGELLAKARALGAKGGGKGGLVSIVFPSGRQAEEFVEEIKRNAQENG